MTRAVRFPLGQVAITANASLRLSHRRGFDRPVPPRLRRLGRPVPGGHAGKRHRPGSRRQAVFRLRAGRRPLLGHHRGRPFRNDRAAARRLLTAWTTQPVNVTNCALRRSCFVCRRLPLPPCCSHFHPMPPPPLPEAASPRHPSRPFPLVNVSCDSLCLCGAGQTGLLPHAKPSATTAFLLARLKPPPVPFKLPRPLSARGILRPFA